MKLSARTQVMWWGGAALLSGLVLWQLGTVIMPFLIGAGIAYLLDPIADRLERAGLSRTAAVSLITLVALLAFVAVTLLVVPALIRQTTALVQAAPGMVDRLQMFLAERFPDLLPEGGTIRSALSDLSSVLTERSGKLISSVLGSVAGLFSLIALFVIVPVVAFYLLLDWDHMVARIDALLPREHADTIRNLARQIDDTLSGFLRGQGTVIVILGTFYSVLLWLIGLPYGLAIGMLAAMLSFIPYVGVLVGGAMAIGVALFYFWSDPVWIGATVAIFAAGQVMEGNYLQPKIVGGHVGLHPVWLMLALSVFGALFGFVGLVVAVPLAAALGVLVRYATERYRESALYTGQGQTPVETPPMQVELIRRRRAEPSREGAVPAGDDAPRDADSV